MNTEPISVAARIAAVRDSIARAETDFHRPPHSVTLIAASKGQPESSIREACAAGQRGFGESYLQEALPKMAALADLAIEWHFIGQIQSNKTRAIAEHFSWVHGVDRARIAQRLGEQRPPHLPPLNICLQVKLSDESAKGGIAPDMVDELSKRIADWPGVRLRGVSTIPPPSSDFDTQREAFRKLRLVAEKLARGGITIDTLSMGMSGDFVAAIAEGATIIRVGTAIFGPRNAAGVRGLVRNEQ